MQNTNQKFQYLEALRFILALIVVTHHFILLFYPTLYYGSYYIEDFAKPHTFSMIISTTPLNIFMNGHLAVCLFLVLSGYVLSYSFLKTNNIVELKHQLFKRYFRLALPSLAICIFIFLIHKIGILYKLHYPTNNEVYQLGNSLFKKDLNFLNMIIMGLYKVPINGDNTYLPILWTVNIELLGALLLFAFILINNEFEKKWLNYLILLVVLALIGKWYYFLIIAGSFMACYQTKITFMLKLLLLILGLYFSGIPNISDEARHYTIYKYSYLFGKDCYLYFHVIAALCLFLVIITSSTFQKIGLVKPLAKAGNLTFSLYLVHIPVLFVLGTFILNLKNGSFNLATLFFICLIVCIVFSWFFYIAIDKPFIKLSNKIANSILRYLNKKNASNF